MPSVPSSTEPSRQSALPMPRQLVSLSVTSRLREPSFENVRSPPSENMAAELEVTTVGEDR